MGQCFGENGYRGIGKKHAFLVLDSALLSGFYPLLIGRHMLSVIFNLITYSSYQMAKFLVLFCEENSKDVQRS